MKSHNDHDSTAASERSRVNSGMRTIAVTGLASLSFLLVLAVRGEVNDWSARVVTVGSLLMWAVMTWYVYQRE